MHNRNSGGFLCHFPGDCRLLKADAYIYRFARLHLFVRSCEKRKVICENSRDSLPFSYRFLRLAGQVFKDIFIKDFLCTELHFFLKSIARHIYRKDRVLCLCLIDTLRDHDLGLFHLDLDRQFLCHVFHDIGMTVAFPIGSAGQIRPLFCLFCLGSIDPYSKDLISFFRLHRKIQVFSLCHAVFAFYLGSLGQIHLVTHSIFCFCLVTGQDLFDILPFQLECPGIHMVEDCHRIIFFSLQLSQNLDLVILKQLAVHIDGITLAASVGILIRNGRRGASLASLSFGFFPGFTSGYALLRPVPGFCSCLTVSVRFFCDVV